MPGTYYIYIMTNAHNTVLYTGATNNLVRRAYEHREHLSGGFTGKYQVTKLVYYEQCDSPETAINREKQLKAGSRQKKLDLIMISNPEFRDLYPEIV